jgi:Uma2 family endonuclease
VGGHLPRDPASELRPSAVAEQLAVLLGPLARAAGLEPLLREFGLGGPDDYRVPDGGLHREVPSGVWHPTAALVVEIVSPGDDTWQKLPFYAAHKVDELLVIDPRAQTADLLERRGDRYEPIANSSLIDLDVRELAGRIAWPEEGATR